MKKIVHLEPYFPTGEATVQPVILWSGGKSFVEPITKHASVGTEYFRTIQPIPGHSIVYVLAVSAHETYGENKNGDGFPEFPYHESATPPWISPEETLPQHYKTFEKYGHNYRHHANKDPKKSVGSVMKAFWNPGMHRVELLIDLENSKAPDLAERIEAGEHPPVSMGVKIKWDVCVTPDTLVRTSEGYKRIENIQRGDHVRTHTGVLKQVNDTLSRTVTDELMEVKTSSAPPIKCTDTHPFYIVRKEQIRTCQGSVGGVRLRHQVRLTESKCRRCNRDIVVTPEWIRAEDLHIGDYVLTPVDPCSKVVTVGTESAQLLGLYVGDGYVFRSPQTHDLMGVNIDLDAAQDDLIIKTENLLSTLAENGAKIHPAGRGKKGIRIVANDQGLAQWLVDMGGQYSRKKRLAESVFTWSIEEKKAFIGGYIDSDGSFDTTSGVTRIATVNRGLALDTQRILHSLEVPSSVSYGGHTKNEEYGSDTDYWYIVIPASHGHKFEPYSLKVTAKNVKFGGSRTFFLDGYWYTPIRSLKSIGGVHDVYNLSVENDESYIAEGLSVHNCNVCGNRAPTRKQYCEHLMFQMKQVLPGGLRVAALNPNPKFFDISWVFKPADINAYMMKKVAEPMPYEISGAEAGEYLDTMESRKIASRKLAVLDKVIQGIPVDAKSSGMDPVELENLMKMRPSILAAGENTPDLPDDVLHNLSSFSLPKVLSTMCSGGMSLSTPEFTKIVIYKSYPKSEVREDVLDKSVAIQRSILEFLEDYPQVLDQLKASGILNIEPKNVDIKVAELLDPYMEKRSGIGDYLSRRFIPESYRTSYGPKTQMLTLQDPMTGRRYGTTRGAAISAHDEIAKRNIYKILGGSALLGGAYKIIGSNLAKRGLQKMNPLVGLTMAGLGASQIPSMGKHYITDQGMAIPTMTELVPMKHASMAMPLFGTLAAMAALSHDYQSRLRRGEPVGHPALPLSRRVLDRMGGFIEEHPLVSAGIGTLALHRLGGTRAAKHLSQKVWPTAKGVGSRVYGGAKSTLKDFVGGVKISSWLEKELPRPSGTVMLPEMDLDTIAEKIGEIIAEG